MNKKAFITGASRGIGRGIAQKLAANGYDIAITYNSKLDEAQSLAKEVEEMGSKFYYYQASLEEADVPEEVTKKAISDLGGIDLLVCNAGLTKKTSIFDMTKDFIDFVYNLNFRAYILCTKVAAQYMKDNKVQGNIVYISSTRGLRAYEDDSMYGGLKAGLNRAVESFAIELAQYKIRINSIAPGATAKNNGPYPLNQPGLIPLDRIGKPEDIGNLVKFLASEEASYITGDTIKVDGGLILPGIKENFKKPKQPN